MKECVASPVGTCSLSLLLLSSLSPFSLFPTGKVFVPKQRPIETRQEEVTTLDPELEEALSSATDTELCDLAGETATRKKQTPSLTPPLSLPFSAATVHFPNLGSKKYIYLSLYLWLAGWLAAKQTANRSCSANAP